MRLDDGQIEVIDDRVAEILRRMTPAERIRLGLDCARFVRQIMAGGIRAQHPDFTEEQVAAEIARRWLSGTD